LFLAATPRDLPPLRLDLEMRQIWEQFRLARFRGNFALEYRPAVRLMDISQSLIEYSPRIVHLSVHASPDGAVYLEDDAGYSAAVAPDAIVRLFHLYASTIDCVVLNASEVISVIFS
jgi:hypothetical protein